MVKKNHNRSLNLAIIFFAVFVFLIIVSLICKVVALVNRSIFDGENQITINVIDDNKNKSKLISFSPKNNSIYIVDIINSEESKNIKSALEIPIDEVIYTKKEINEKNLKQVLFLYSIPFLKDKTSLTIVDFIRLFLYANSVPTNSLYSKQISLKSNFSLIKNSGIYSFFIDPKIAEEKASIEIINGTNVFGLGNKLASFISNTGGNVIMVSNADREEVNSKIIYFEKESYTVKKLARILNLKKEKAKNKKFGEITIVIGKDSLNDLRF